METKQFRQNIQASMIKVRKTGIAYYNSGENNKKKPNYDEELANNENFKKLFNEENLWFHALMTRQGFEKVNGPGITEPQLFHGGCLTGSSLHIEDHKFPR